MHLILLKKLLGEETEVCGGSKSRNFFAMYLGVLGLLKLIDNSLENNEEISTKMYFGNVIFCSIKFWFLIVSQSTPSIMIGGETGLYQE